MYDHLYYYTVQSVEMKDFNIDKKLHCKTHHDRNNIHRSMYLKEKITKWTLTMDFTSVWFINFVIIDKIDQMIQNNEICNEQDGHKFAVNRIIGGLFDDNIRDFPCDYGQCLDAIIEFIADSLRAIYPRGLNIPHIKNKISLISKE